jgi:hypothetical protein
MGTCKSTDVKSNFDKISYKFNLENNLEKIT